MTPGDRDRIASLLQDSDLSYRAISRETGYSDWTIRKVAREIAGDPTPMKQWRPRTQESETEVSPLTGWLVSAGIVLGVIALIWAAVRSSPPE